MHVVLLGVGVMLEVLGTLNTDEDDITRSKVYLMRRCDNSCYYY
jgi:hypothetical protein